MKIKLIKIHEKRDEFTGKNPVPGKCPVCWIFNPVDAVLMKVPFTPKECRNLFGNIPGVLINRSQKIIKKKIEILP